MSFFRSGRAFRTVLLTVLASLWAAGWAQTSPRRRPPFRFDVRRFDALQKQLAGTAESAASKLVEQRQAAALAAAAQPGGPHTTLLRLNDFGLPEAVLHAGGAPAPGSGEPLTRAISYLRGQSALFPFSESDLEGLRTAATSRSNGLTFLTLNQTVNGIPVFRGHVRMVFNASGAVVHAGVDAVIPRLSIDTRPRLQPAEAASRALEWLQVGALPGALAELASSGPGRTVFSHPEGEDFGPIATELSIFPMTADTARLAYRVFAGSQRGRFELLFDAADGRLLYAANLRQEAGRALVWRESPVKGSRESVNFPDSWLPAGTAVTTGNNSDVYLDADGDDEPDSEEIVNISDGRAHSPSGSFDFPAGEGSTGQDPFEFPAAAVTNAFYFVNAAHDYFYDLGFTEQAGNFQTDNLGRGGLGEDAVQVHVHDGLAFGGAQFLSAEEGVAPRLELSINSRGTFFEFNDDRDYALDGEVVFHEYAHGVTDRIVGGPDDVSCLFGMQSGALSEGWSDYFALSHFNNPVMADYIAANAEQGLRRQAYDRNQLTYEDLGNDGFEIHNDGEIWAATLWEIRQALGPAITDRLVTDALRLTPCGPQMIQARGAVLDADQAAHGGSHHAALWQIFARRGMGHAASGFDGEFLDSNVFNAAFNLPPAAGANSYPAVIGRPRELALVGDPYLYTVLATDTDGDTLRFELVSGPPGMTVDPTSGRVSFTPPSIVAPRAKVAVTDGKGGRVIHGFSVPVLALLTPGRALTIEGAAGSQGFAAFTVPANTPVLQVTLRGGEGDPDILIVGPDLNISESTRPGMNETLSIAAPAAGIWVAVVTGVEAYSGVSLAASFPRATTLAVNSRLDDLQGPRSSETFRQFTVPEGATSFTVSTGGGSGDVDLYVARGRYPVCQFSLFVFQDCDFDEASLDFGNFETATVNGAAAAKAIQSNIGKGAALALRLAAGEPVTVPIVEAGQWFLNLSATSTFQNVSLTITIDTADSTAPAITAGGIVNAASYAPQLGPGGIATLFGANLAAETAQAGSVPLTRELGGVRVLVNGIEAPLFYVSPGQINFQTPFETAAGPAAVLVERGGLPSAIRAAAVQTNAPGIFTYQPATDTTAPVIVHLDGSVVTPANPARAGEVLVVFATGVGGLSDPPATGEASAAAPLAGSTVDPTVTVGEAEATVLFAGLTPGFVGLLQINVQLPESLPAGDELELVATFGPDAAQTVKLAVE